MSRRELRKMLYVVESIGEDATRVLSKQKAIREGAATRIGASMHLLRERLELALDHPRSLHEDAALEGARP